MNVITKGKINPLSDLSGNTRKPQKRRDGRKGRQIGGPIPFVIGN